MMIKILKKIFLLCMPKRIFMVNGSHDENKLYLTFDDGPTPKITEELLKLLAEYEAKATFFVIGEHLNLSMEIGKLLVNAGHSVGNHSLNHKKFGSLPLGQQLSQADGATNIIDRLPAKQKKLFRPPQGSWSLSLIMSLFIKGYQCIHWSYDSKDYTEQTVDQIINKFMERPVKSGDIVLFHDDSHKCINVLKVLLPIWKDQGYTFERIV